MTKPNNPQPYLLPSFKIKEVSTLLEREGKIYAQLIHAVDKRNHQFTMRERKGLPIKDFINIPVECVAEITKAQFFNPETEKSVPKGGLKAIFMGWDTGYKFFSELVSMIEGETGDPDEDEDFDEDEYMELSANLFLNWGVTGFGLASNRDKPMLKTEDGTFFLNEFIFEKHIDKWEDSPLPFVKVGIVIEELLLHGIKPIEGEWKSREKTDEYDSLKDYEGIIVGRPKEIDGR